MKKVWLVLFCLALVPVEMIWSGYALSVLWKWFVVPVFNFHPLSVVQATGISLVIGFLTHQYIKNDDDSKEELVRATLIGFLRPAIALFLGRIITTLM